MSKTKSPQAMAVRQSKPTQMTVARPTVYYDSHSEPSAAAVSAHEEIALRAYQIYVEKGRPEGQSEQIWRQAERELRNRDMTSLSR